MSGLSDVKSLKRVETACGARGILLAFLIVGGASLRATPAAGTHVVARWLATAGPRHGLLQDAGLSACAGAGTPANAVARYYLALDERRFAAAFACLDPDARPPYDRFVAGFATTVAVRLLVAVEEGGEGVRVILHGYSQAGRALRDTTFQGRWQVSDGDALEHPAIARVRQVVVSAIPRPDIPGALTAMGQSARSVTRARITGDGTLSALYLTSGPDGALVWIFSGGRLIFADPVDTEQPSKVTIRPGADGGSFDVATIDNGLTHWAWDGAGFSAAASTISVQPAAARVGQLVTVSGRTLGSVRAVPPDLYMASPAVHRLPAAATPVQCGEQAATVPVTWSNLMAVRSSTPRAAAPPTAYTLPPGAPWSVTFRVPARLDETVTSPVDTTPVPTEAGAYRLVAVFPGTSVFCPRQEPAAPDPLSAVAAFRVQA